MINILDYIPRGSENAITRNELSLKTKLGDRQVRELISQKRKEGEFIISSTQGKGYYLPETRAEVERFIMQQKSYIKNLQKGITKAEKALKIIPDQITVL